jgi:cytochrome c553
VRVLLAGAALLVACSSSDAAAPACTDVLPACPASGAPSYASTVAPLVAAACLSCHAPGGEQSSRTFETYAHLYAQRSPVLNQLHACLMPPVDGPQLSDADRQTIETWLVCGAPNN